MKYIAALALLAVPLAIAAAPNAAEAHARDGYRCHVVKKEVRKFGKKRYRFVKVCRKTHSVRKPGFKKHYAKRDYRHFDRRR